MKSTLTLALLSTLGMAAATASAHEDLATVISATPVVQRVAVPTRQCWNEQVAAVEERRVRVPGQVEYSEPRANSGAGTVLGAIIGGVVGHQFGNSTGGRDHGTVAGAVIGGLVGNSIDRENAEGGVRRVSQDAYTVERVPVTREVQRCRTNTEYRDQVVGYDVRYRYGNRDYLTRMDHNPGPTLPVRIEVRPGYR
ncbi:MAG: glycine zipper 2TM domain-containing protein [Betaproteobacteria bacterium]|nr:glycine zipper 2TM domain-containing protein [Betaproteobacteria bacterium]